MPPPLRTLLVIAGVWAAAMAVGLWLDAPVARMAHRAAVDRDPERTVSKTSPGNNHKEYRITEITERRQDGQT